MQYALLIRQRNAFKCEVSVPNAADVGKVIEHALKRDPEGLDIRVYPVPHLPPDMAPPIDAMPYGAINIVDVNLK